MGSRMKTTIEISDALLEAAKERAREEGTTLRAVVERGLREVLYEAPERPAPRAPLTGRLDPLVDLRDWRAVEDIIYEPRHRYDR
jgi:hypothetical protein